MAYALTSTTGRPLVAIGLVAALSLLSASRGRGTPQGGARPISDVHYVVAIDSARAQAQTFRVSMEFTTADPAPVLLSLPAWTPGDYEIRDFSRNVLGFSASSGGHPLRWDKVDPDTWRVFPEDAGPVRVEFDYLADELVCSTAWIAPDAAFFNGTNLFPYPEGMPLDYPSRVTIQTGPGWRIATGMRALGDGEYEAGSYDELADMPFALGRLQVDSLDIGGRTFRLATYPVGAMDGDVRQAWWDDVARMMEPMAAVFGEVPFDSYTVLLVFDEHVQARDQSALEHEDSFLGVFLPDLIDDPVLTQITAHEIFHAWNVKRLRPAAMTPYDYHAPQFSTLLWFVEGVTDYYADLALVRAGITTAADFYAATLAKIEEVDREPPVALEDASLSAWIAPRDGTADLYYQKGSLAALMLDILIRDATDNRASLDVVMADLYRSSWLEGSAFDETALWETIGRIAGGEALRVFDERYVDGRDAYPWAEVLPLAGLALVADTTAVPTLAPSTLGLRTGTGEIFVQKVGEASPLQEAGVQPGDVLVRLGEIDVTGVPSLQTFRDRYGGTPAGTPVPIHVRRGETELTLRMNLRLTDRVTRAIRPGPAPGPKAEEVRRGLLTGHAG